MGAPVVPVARSFPFLRSCLCTERTLLRPDFQAWARALGEVPDHLHRKVWEWAYICQALAERGMLAPGKRGLGFAVGREPLVALFAARGAQLVATDLAPGPARASGWLAAGQHAAPGEAPDTRGLCDPQTLRRQVEFRHADMRAIAPTLHGRFDFLWSACAFEHLGSIERGLRFVEESLRCLKPGGVAVHTTEFNVSSDTHTIEDGATVLFRRSDIEDLAGRLRAAGHGIDIDWDMGDGVADGHIDVPPYKHDVHLKLQLGHYTITSIGLVIRRRPA